MLHKRWGLLVLLLLVSSRAAAVTRVVAPPPTGSGTTCTAAAPCSLTTGMSQTVAGDTLILMNGTYAQAFNTVNSGTLGNPITIQAAEKHQAIIRVSSGNITSLNHDYLVIRGLRFDGQGTAGVNGGIRMGPTLDEDAHHITFEHNLVENMGYSCIHVATGEHDIVIRHNLIRHCGMADYWGEGLYLGNKGDISEASGLTNTVSAVEVYGNTFERFTENGVDIKQYAQNIAIHHNIFREQIPCTEQPACTSSDGSRGFANHGTIEAIGADVTVADNILSRNKPRWGSFVIGPSRNIQVTANVIEDELQPVDSAFPNTSQVRLNNFSFGHPPTILAASTVTGNTYCDMTTDTVLGGTGLTVSGNAGLPGGVAQSVCDGEVERIMAERAELPGSRYAPLAELTLLDDCNRVESPLSHGGRWTNSLISTHTTPWRADGASCGTALAGNASVWWNAETFGPNTAIQADIPDATGVSAQVLGLFVRLQEPGVAGATDGYECRFTPFDATASFRKWTNGASAALGSVCTGVTMANGDQIGCEMIGTTLNSYRHDGTMWAKVCTTTDASITAAGAVGLLTAVTAFSLDNIRACTLDAAGACVPQEVTAGFVEPPVIDTCNRTQNPLASGWVGPLDPDIPDAILANGSVCLASAPLSSSYWGTLVGADQVLTMTMPDATAPSGAHWAALYVRVQQPSAVANTVDGYRCTFTPFTSTVELHRMDEGTFVPLVSAAAVSMSDTDQIGCRIVGSTLSAWINHLGAGWTLAASTTDSTYTGTGYVGLALISTGGINVDDMGFAAVVSAETVSHGAIMPLLQ